MSCNVSITYIQFTCDPAPKLPDDAHCDPYDYRRHSSISKCAISGYAISNTPITCGPPVIKPPIPVVHASFSNAFSPAFNRVYP